MAELNFFNKKFKSGLLYWLIGFEFFEQKIQVGITVESNQIKICFIFYPKYYLGPLNRGNEIEFERKFALFLSQNLLCQKLDAGT